MFDLQFGPDFSHLSTSCRGLRRDGHATVAEQPDVGRHAAAAAAVAGMDIGGFGPFNSVSLP